MMLTIFLYTKYRHAIEKREMQVLMNDESRNVTVNPQTDTPSTSQNGSIEIEWSQELITSKLIT